MLNPATRRRGAVAAVSVCALVVGLLGGTGSAQARQAADPLTPRTKFVMKPDGSSGANKVGAGIPNIDSVKATIRTYYAASNNGIADKKKSPYITEIAKLLNEQNAYLSQNAQAAPKPAIVLDVDDTTLWNYDMEDGELHFDYDPVVQNTWVQEQKFPAVPGMAEFVDKAVKLGYTVFGVTGRADTQEAATLANLTKAGFGTAFTADTLFTKWTGNNPQPAYVTCLVATSCTTVEYKAGTRAHIEAGGYTIMLNVGDQWSDLMGGHANKVLKLPNPTYYLPSPNLPGVSEPNLVPRNVFSMEPDGSSGETEGGEGIPNFDSVVATIRAYYNAPDGIANKKASRYITEMKKLRDKWAPRLRTRCTNQAALGNRPAVVFDTDDTTLWTYDMRDAAMHFSSDPVVQDEWVQGKKFEPVPGMRRVVKAAKDGGCKVVGLTGRGPGQRKATLQNLRKYYGDAFRSRYYFTRWAAGKQPAYITCEVEDECTLVEFKSQTRAHVEQKFKVKIIANFGDQYSDLLGGHGWPVKLPNPARYVS